MTAKIIQIRAIKNAAGAVVIMGLAADNRIYCWDSRTATWILEKDEVV